VIHSRITGMWCVKTGRAGHAVGLWLMFGALACGGRAADGSQPPQPSYSAPPTNSTPTSPPVATAARPPTPASQRAPTPPLPQQPLQRRTNIDPEYDLGQAAAENVLLANCGQCHGPSLAPDQAQAGINYINDTDRLVDAGLIVPLSSVTSRIIVTMRTGSMPPRSSGLLPVTEADIGLVASYIDNPRYWPDLAPPVVVDAGIVRPIVDGGADGG
jgi:mono/diheme cytochrome c family protein